MKIAIVLCAILLFCLPAAEAAEGLLTGVRKHGQAAQDHLAGTDPEAVPKYADSAESGIQPSFRVQPIHDNGIFAVFRTDRLEYQINEGENTDLWDVQAWVGEDYNKIWLKSEGLWLTDKGEFEEAEVELLYSRNVATFWDLQAGIRHDFEPHPTRSFAVVGVEGLARYWFEVEAAAYISDDGDLSANLKAEYDLLLSQRLILQPRLEINAALQEVEGYNIGQGINDITLGARLRYEIRRELAPYIGVSWHQKVGQTADLAKADGEDTDVISFVIGLRIWL